jgi:hypothetical protein
MGEILAGVSAIRSGRDAAVAKLGIPQTGGQQYTGGIPQTGAVDMSQASGVPDFGMSGQSQVGGQQQGDSYVEAPQASAVDNSIPSGNPLDPSMAQPSAYGYNPYDTAPELQERIADDDELDDEEVTIKGDDWKPPHKENILGKVMDTLLMLRGRQPVFRPKVDAANMRDAFASHGSKDPPEMLFNRIEKINAPVAEEMRRKYHQVHNRDELIKLQEESVLAQAEERKQKARNALAPTLKAIQKSNDPEGMAARILPEINKRAARMGLEPITDINDVDAWLEGSLSVDDDIDNQALEQHRSSTRANQQRNTSSLISKRQSDASVSRERLDNDIADDKADNARADRDPGKKAPRVVKTPNGMMEISPNGITGRIGDQIWQKTGEGNQWKRIK